MLTLRTINCTIFMILNLLAHSNGNILQNQSVINVFLRDKVSLILVFFFIPSSVELAAYCSNRGYVDFIVTGHDCTHLPLERTVRSWSLGRP